MSKIKVTGGVKVSGIVRAARFNVPPVWDTIAGSLGTPFENQAFSVTPGATDPDTFPDANITYSLVSGSLPSGLTLNSATSEISGTPAAVGSDTLSNFTLRAADGEIGANKPGKFDERDFSITVLNDVAPSFDQAANFSIGSVAELAAASLFQITATDPNTNPQLITFSEVGAVLVGDNLSLDSEGNVTGTPPDAGGTRVVTFTVRASDGTLTTDQDYKLTITDSQDPVWVTAVGLLATVNESEAITTITLEATDDNAVSYSVTSGALPGGLTLNSSNGEITGTPSNVAEDTTSDFEVTATDTVELDFTARCFSIKVLNVIANSLRFNDDDQAFLTRTNGTSSDNTRFTFSTWIKRGNFGINTQMLSADDGVDNGDWAILSFDDADRFQFQHRIANVVQYQILSTTVFRDPSAWYHFVLIYNSNEGTANDRVKVYTNGVLITAFDVQTNPSSALSGMFGNTSGELTVGRFEDNNSQYLDGYLAETYFVDGLALAVTDFGAFDANGDWQPKEYSGGFGTNGFHLDYAVAPGTGNGGGTDVSGNANHFTDSGLAANDQVSDSPTNNHCTLTPLQFTTDATKPVLSNGNLVVTRGDTDSRGGNSTFAATSGKWYWEVTITTYTDTINEFILAASASNINNVAGHSNDRFQVRLVDGLWQKFDGSGGTAAGAIGAQGDVYGFEMDLDTPQIEIFLNGSSVLTDTTITAADAAKGVMPAYDLANNTVFTFNFGQQSFVHTPTSGFVALNTGNLSDPTIEDPSDHFDTLLYTGNATASTDITGLDFQPDLVWIKNRSQADEHKLVDAVRGATEELNSDSNNIESTDANGLTAFNSDGFELGTGAGGYNDTGESFVAWNWNESTTPGFDIVSYTGTGSAHAENHSLGVVPAMMIVKGRNTTSAQHWRVYHEGVASDPETDYLALNLTNAVADNIVIWNDTAPTSTQFTIGTSTTVNEDTKNYIAYLWAGVEGFSKFGTYEGNGAADGTFVWCGFRPAFLMIKQTNEVRNWRIKDTARNAFNVSGLSLFPDLTNADTTTNLMDILSNGFKMRSTSAGTNGSGGTYIFAAFAESPFKTARGR